MWLEGVVSFCMEEMDFIKFLDWLTTNVVGKDGECIGYYRVNGGQPQSLWLKREDEEHA